MRQALVKIMFVCGAVVACTASTVAAAEPRLAKFQETQLHMGVEFEIVLYAQNEQQAKEVFSQAFARIAELDKAMSDYDPASELSRLSETSAAGAPTKPIKISDDLMRVLAHAQDVSRQTSGAFDVTVGPLTKLWRRARRQKELPSAEQLAEARASVGFQFLKLDPDAQTAQLLKPNMRLDLGGIAKGFAADEALAVIRKAGLRRALVRASGDIAAGDSPPGENGWRIGLAPLNPDDPPKHFVRLANLAVSTSGDARQHLVVDGRRYSHIIDPRSGMGISGRSSVTVIAPRGMQSDSLASAVSILGPEKGLNLVNSLKETALLMVVEEEDDQPQEVESPSFRQFREKADGGTPTP